MMDFAAARRMMVDGQVRTYDVTDLRLLAAMLEVPRERFVPAAALDFAYSDRAVPLDRAGTRCLLKPMVLAKLLQAAELGAQDRVLDVGCGTGYSAAVIGTLTASVVALEQNADLAHWARAALSDVGSGNVSVVTDILAAGWPAGAPYDVIVLEGACEDPPAALCRQLKDGGRLVCVLGRGPAGKAMLYRKVGGDVSGWPIFDAAAPLLPGFERAAEFVF
jgi:protein-L-isoaspartate(D-aspartate) O-methyltransferase